MSVPGIPDSVPLAKVAESVRVLGIDPAQVIAVSWGVREVQVSRYRLNERGDRFVDGESYATETHTVPVMGWAD